jgi:hypothetical protein
MNKDKIIEKTMLEYKQGTLRSSSGDIVTKRSQALAIALTKANSGKFAEGGKINENLEMINSDNKAIIHHAEELKTILRKNKEIPTWAVTLINQAENNISNVTHYLDGKLSYDYGGMIPEIIQKVYGENLVFIDRYAQERIGTINNLYPDHAEVFIDDKFVDVPNWRITKILSKDIELNKKLIKEIQDTYMLKQSFDSSDVWGLETMEKGGKLLIASLGAYLLAGETAQKIAPKSVSALDERMAERLNPNKPNIWEDRGLRYSDGGGVGNYVNQYFWNGYENDAIIELRKALPNHTFEKGKNSIIVDGGKFVIHTDFGKYGFIRAYSNQGSEGGLSVQRLDEAISFINDNKYSDGGGVPDRIMDINISRVKSEFRNEPQIFSGEIIKRGPNEFKIENGILYIKRPNENWQQFRIIKFGDGGGVPYKYPKYKLSIYGTYIFRTGTETFELKIYMSERRNDTEDSLVIEEVKNSNVDLGSIIVKNSALTRLTKGLKVKAKSSIGNYSGTIEKISD